MKLKYNSMTIYVTEDYQGMSAKAAALVAAQVTLKANSILGLATGSTPEGMYADLVDMYKKQQLDFSEVTSFNLDEYYALEPSNDQSYDFYMRKNFFDHVNMMKTHIPSGVTEDVKKLCRDYDRSISKAGDIDLQILGIGNNGHIGFNEPDIKFEAGTHLVELDDETIKANARFFASEDEVPRQAISMGIKNIMHSKKIVLMANGSPKAHVLAEMMFGPVTPNLPASILQLHNDVTLILDKEAAKEMVEKIQENGNMI